MLTLRPVHARAARAFALPALLALLVAGCKKDDIVGVETPIIETVDQLLFPELPPGSTFSSVLVIENTGAAPLVFGNVAISGSAEFQVVGLEQGTTIQPGDVFSAQVVYSPVDEIADSGVLRIPNNSANDPDAEVVLTTQEQFSQILPDPAELVIASPAVGTPSSGVVRLYNVGTRAIDLTSGRLLADTGRFQIQSVDPPFPATIQPDGFVAVTISYQASSGGVDVDELLVECSADNCVEGRFRVPINGIAEQPRLRVSPGDVAFGAVALEPSPVPTQTIRASNEGQGTLLIQSIAWAINPADGDDEFQIVSVAGEAYDPARSEPWALAAGEAMEIVLSYDPADAEPDLENLAFRSNDAGLPLQTVRVAGRLSAPRLEVLPTTVEFPLTAIGLRGTREVVIRNAGAETLLLDPLRTLGGGFTDGTFTLLNGGDMPSELAAGEQFTLQIEYAPTEPDLFFAGTIYVLPQNDPLTSEVRVDVTASSAREPECNVRPLPATVNFGTVPRGTRRELVARMRNTGTGPCEIRSVRKQAGGGFGGLFGTDYFELVGTSIPTPFELLPGEEFEVTVAYFPLTSTDLSEAFGDTGSVEVQVRDPYDTARTVTCGVSSFGATRACGFNLQARSGVAELAVIPGDIDFGPVTLGCNSQTQTLRVYNTGNADIVVTGVAPEDCSGEFAIAGVPAMPLTLRRGESFAFQVRYRPDAEGGDLCNVIVTSEVAGSERTVVPLLGEGVTYSRTVDRFEQTPGREVDVLFVVDNSGSMGEEQSNLSRNFSSFITEAVTWDIDFQLGIVTTQTEDTIPNPGGGGDAEPGELLGATRIITPRTPSFQSVFQSQVRVGDSDTTASSTERGLEAARLALSDPNITDLGIPCSTDADCTAPYQCVQAADFGPRACGGHNRTFLREDASLEIVFVSDEEDSSRAELSFYVDFFKSIKGYRNTSLFHASAIVGPRGGCESSAGTADAGNRYLDVADQTGGLVGSICDSNFSRILGDIGDRAFGVRVQFFLSRVADPATVRVYDVPCGGTSRTPRTTGWTFDAESNSVVFTEAVAPVPGQCFEVEYEAACF
jgi:hypothetical protein